MISIYLNIHFYGPNSNSNGSGEMHISWSLMISVQKHWPLGIWSFIGPPRSSWDLLNHVRARMYVRWRSRNLFIGLFWFLAQIWGFPMRRKWQFVFCQKNPVLVAFSFFAQKMAIFRQKSAFRLISWNPVIGSS